jgi:SdrD B-like domain/Secretion system C-terminal sorting domain
MKQTSTFLLVLFCIALSTVSKAQSTGTVFRDFNGNGTKEVNEPFVPGVTVNAYNAAEALAGTSVTTAAGFWSITPTGGYPIRVEFVLNSAAATNCFFNPGVDFSGYSGATYGTSVRFLAAQTSGLTYAVSYPAEYVTNTNPRIATSVYTNGNLTTGAGNSGNLRDAVTVQYNTVNAVSPIPGSNNTQVTLHADMGSVWGVAHHLQSGKLLYSAVLKRHSGLGPGGSGAVYLTDPATATGATVLFNLDFLGFPTRATGTYPYAATSGQAAVNNIPYTGVIGTNAERGIPNGTTPYSSFASPGDAHSYDAAAFAQVGKVGLGGLDVSDDGKYVFVMNLFDKKLYRITLVNPATPGTPAITAADVKSFTLTDPAYAGGTYRPWAVKYYRGKIFVGMANDLSGTALLAGTTSIANGSESTVPKYANAKGSIYSLDNPATTGTGAFTFVTDIALNYANLGVAGEIDGFDKLAASAVADGVNENHIFRYNPWNDNYDNFKQDNTQGNMKLCFPQPILSDIEFDINSNAIAVGLMDRLGLQCSYRTYSPKDQGPDDGPLNSTQAAYGNSELASGDLIKVPFTAICGIGIILPNNSAANNEFYGGDYFGNLGVITPPFHQEIASGGLMLLPGTNEIMTNCYDPSTSSNSGGLKILSNATGQSGNDGTVQYGANVYDASTRGITSAKGVGMGDIELIRELAPIEAGNRIWNDANGDGIQGAGEPGIANVTLELFADFNNDGVPDGAALASTNTSASGDWYFNNANVPDGDPTTAGAQIGLKAGTVYLIRIAAADWNSTTGAGAGDLAGLRITKTDVVGSGQVDFSDNDAALTTGAIIVPQIKFTAGNAGENNHNLDFGFKSLASLGNKVWLDEGAGGGTRNNGLQDGTEPGVAGVPVTLYLNGPNGTPGDADDILVGSTITDAFGIYMFDNLTPSTSVQTEYNIRVTPPANYSFTVQSNATDDNNTTGASTTGSDVNPLGTSYSINLSAGENNPNIDAGLILRTPPVPSSIGDRVWFDTNGDGNQDSGEPGVAGVTVTLYDQVTGNVIAVTTTDANGNYLFNNLPNGTYQVGFSAPAGTVLSLNVGGTTPGNGTTNSDADPATGKTGTITISAAGTQITGIDAGLSNDLKGAIGDFVWNDIDRDGIQDAGEPGIPGVAMQLYDAGPDGLIGTADDILKATTVTDANGYYIFPGLDPAKYFVVATPPTGYNNLSPKDVTTGNPGGDVKDSDFGAGAGPYALKFVSPVKILNSTAGGVTRDMTVDLGLYNSTNNLNSLGDKVWNDINANGLLDGTEAGVPNITVRLLDGTGVAVNNPATGKPYVVVTDSIGNYKFVDLPDGNYIVEFANLPAGYSFTAQDASGTGNPGSGTDGTNDSDAKTTTGRTGIIDLGTASPTGVNLTNVDAGIKQGIPAGTASLGNRVWYDINNNGLQDAGELGVSNVRVELLDGLGAAVDSDPNTAGVQPYLVYTNGLGEYLFTGLPAGDYTVRFSNFPVGYTSSAVNQGTNDAIDADANFAGTSVTATTTATTGIYTLQTGEDNLTVDMGIVPAAGTNSIGNFVWNDQNSDGKQDATEPGVQGVTVTLYTNGVDGVPGTADDVIAGVTTTDSLGRYSFVGLPNGNYNVGFSNLPAGFNFTPQNVPTSTAANGSDANSASGRTGTVALTGGTNTVDLDAGIVTTRAALGNYVWLDANANGIQDAGEAGVSGVTVTLYAADGTTVLASTVTDADGKYYFGNLTAGSYVVGFSTIPANLNYTLQNTPGDNGNNTNSDADPNTGKTAVITLTVGETDLTIDAGLKPSIPASVGNFVWNDLDSDGIQDANEPGVPGIIVTLYDAANNVVGTVVTDGNGKYLISNVPANNGYYIIFSNLPGIALFTTQNSDVTPGDATAGSDANPGTGRTTPFNLIPGQYLPTVDAGILNIQLLPVRLVSFTAQPQGSQVALQWVVAEQSNISSYQVEFSKDGSSFSSFTSVAANNNLTATYNAVHPNPVTGINYYRLRIVDKNGIITYSDVRKVNFGKISTISVFPNPARVEVNITLTAAMVNKAATISILSIDGKLVSAKQLVAASQTETINVSTLASGKYIIRIITGNEVINKTIEVIR